MDSGLDVVQDEDDPEGRKNVFCGTASYVSPEVLKDAPASPAVDLWALGCIIFQVMWLGVCQQPTEAVAEADLFCGIDVHWTPSIHGRE